MILSACLGIIRLDEEENKVCFLRLSRTLNIANICSPSGVCFCFVFVLVVEPGLFAPSSSGLSRFLLDTYDSSDIKDASSGNRPPRYGAFVFGDVIPFNVTVDWDAVREKPETLAMVLEAVSESLPTEGGDFDLEVLRPCVLESVCQPFLS